MYIFNILMFDPCTYFKRYKSKSNKNNHKYIIYLHISMNIY